MQPLWFHKPKDMLYDAKRHDKSRPFGCELCASRFAHKSAFKAHMKRQETSKRLKQPSALGVSRAVLRSVPGRCISGSVTTDQVSMTKHFIVQGEVSVILGKIAVQIH